MKRTYPYSKSERKVTRFDTHVWRSNGYDSKTSASCTKTDSVTLGASPPNWRTILARGGSATSTLSGERYKIHSSMGGGGISTNSSVKPPLVSQFTGNAQNPCPLFVNLSSVNESAANALAIKHLLDMYLEVRNTWRGGNFLAEVGETINMLRHPVRSLFGHTMKLAHGVRKIRKYANNRSLYAKKIGGLWLGYSFGVKPLFDDIKDANAAIAKLAGDYGFDSKPIHGYGRAESIPFQASEQFGSLPGMTGQYSWYHYHVLRSQVKYYGAVNARPMGLSQIAEDFGVSLYDVVPAVWEAIPWSFLVDYFLNVQEVLDSMRFASANLDWMNKGVKHTSIHAGSAPWLSSPLPAKVSESCSVSGVKVERTAVTRVPVQSLPTQSFRFKIPGLGSLKWVNIAALISQIGSSRPIEAPGRNKAPRK